MNPHVGNTNCIIICFAIYIYCFVYTNGVGLGEALTSHVAEDFYDFHRTEQSYSHSFEKKKPKWRIIDYTRYIFPRPMNL
jgi:hypothetical protein